MITEELIVRSLQGRTTAEEEMSLLVWRESAPENDQQYKELAELWSLAGTASPPQQSTAPLHAIPWMIKRAEHRRQAVQQSATPAGGREEGHKRRRPVAVGLLAASVAIISLGLGVLSDRLLLRQDHVVVHEIVTGDAERTTVTLSDGTAVRMGPNSTIRINEGSGDPVVWLEGRAFFGVVPDPSRSFTVRTEYGDAMALGTRFEVRTDEQEFRVLVVEGNVRVSTPANSIEIGEGVMSRSSDGGHQSTERVANMYGQLEWIGSTLVFRATPLRRAIEEIERHYNVEVDLEDTSLGDRTVTATFTEQAVDEVLFVVCQIVGAGCAGEGDHYRVGDRSLGTLSPTIVDGG